MSYRPDIDGLRALAVGVILLFHLGVEGFSGGFVGVDVFFVISGYLITGIILREIDEGEFSFGRFYLRRLRRLGPALFAVTAGTLAAGYLILAPDYLEDLAASTMAALLFLSNILFWLQSGYFDAAAIEKPLLHTWSLGVEEQFYLIWPLAMFALAPLATSRGRLIAVILAGILSLAAAELALVSDPSAAFYLTPFRIYEFCFGAALAVAPMRSLAPRIGNLVSASGLILILVATVSYGKETAFPGFAAVVPCLGSALIIYAGRDAIVNRVLALAPALFIGRISYSLYLVHWPVITFYVYANGRPETGFEIVGLLLFTSALATLLYYAVEMPFRYRRSDRRFAVTTPALCFSVVPVALLIGIMSYEVWAKGGYPGRTAKDLLMFQQTLKEAKKGRLEAIRWDTCYIRADRARFQTFSSCHPKKLDGAVAILGDSHAADLWAGLQSAFPETTFVQLTAAGCPLSRDNHLGWHCDDWIDFAKAWLADHADQLAGVIYTQRAASTMHGNPDEGERVLPHKRKARRLQQNLDEIAALGLPVVFVGPRPEFHPRLDTLISKSSNREEIERRLSRIDIAPYLALDELLNKTFRDSDVTYASTARVVCDDDCRHFLPDGGPLFVDYAHWSPAGGRYMADRLAERHDVLRDLIGLDEEGTSKPMSQRSLDR